MHSEEAPKRAAGTPLRALFLEDHQPDADLILAELRRAGFDPEWTRAASGPEFLASLAEDWQIILADFALPQFDALKALEMLREQGNDTPLIVVTGAVGEEVAVECIKQGAADYLLKDRLTRLPSAVRQALEQRRMRQENARANRVLRDNEQRLRALIEHSSDGMLVVDPAGQVLDRYNDLFPADSDWYSESFLDWMLVEDRPAVRQMWERLGESIETIGFRISSVSGGVRRIEAICNDLRATPCVGAIVIHYRDVTEHLHLEEQLRHGQKMQAVGQLAAGLGHDFNNLLTVISGHSELLAQRGDIPESARSGLLEVQDACTKATSLTRKLLAFSRKETVRRSKTIDLNRVVSDILPLLASLLGSEFELRSSLQEDVGMIRLDETELQQIIMNLVVNARDAMHGSGIVLVETSSVEVVDLSLRTAAQGPRVRLSVSDTGCGMDERTLARIFEPFFTTKDVGKGTGLGLSTVYAIVTNASGEITVDSEPEGGSKFHVILPRAAVELPAAPTRSLEPTSAVSSETILLVDDEDQIRSLLSAILRPLGYRVVEARSGEEAVALWRNADRPIDLLLTDLRMPGMKGPELARQLRAERPELPVLFMSGDTGGLISRADLAREPLLAKPFSAGILTAKVREVLDARPARARVLVVDDSAQIRNLVRAVLERQGYAVDEASDGKRALVAVQRINPDVVITDIVMPDTDGIELIRCIRQTDPHVKIIAMSGAVSRELYLEGAGIMGADATVSKPMVMDDLLATVRELSGRKRSDRQLSGGRRTN